MGCYAVGTDSWHPAEWVPPGCAALQPFSKGWRPDTLPFPPFHALKSMQVGIKPCCSHAPLPRGLARVQLDDKGAPCTHAACPKLTDASSHMKASLTGRAQRQLGLIARGLLNCVIQGSQGWYLSGVWVNAMHCSKMPCGKGRYEARSLCSSSAPVA